MAGPGERLYDELKEKNQIYQDESWQLYVNEVGQRLVEITPHAGKDYHFFVIDNSGVNAMALPDGYIFVNRGLLAYLRSEDELAGVLGHEIGHVVGRHARRTNSVGLFGNVLGVIGAFITGTGAIADLGNTVTQTIRSGYGREFELEADEYGGEFLARAGYNPQAMIDVIHVLKDHSLFAKNVLNQPTVYHGLFSTHPKNDKRLHDAVKKSQHTMPDLIRPPERDFWVMMDGLAYGNEASSGLVRDGTYYNSSLRVVVNFPQEWSVSMLSAEVVGVPTSPSVPLEITMRRLAAGSRAVTLENFVQDTLKRDDLTNGKTMEVNSFEGFAADVEVAEDSVEMRVIAALRKDDSVYVFEGAVGKGGSVDDFLSIWMETIESFRAMNAEDLLIANSQRLKIIEAKPDDTYQELAKSSSIKAYSEETLRVINGHHPFGEPRAGDKIKIVQ